MSPPLNAVDEVRVVFHTSPGHVKMRPVLTSIQLLVALHVLHHRDGRASGRTAPSVDLLLTAVRLGLLLLSFRLLLQLFKQWLHELRGTVVLELRLAEHRPARVNLEAMRV